MITEELLKPIYVEYTLTDDTKCKSEVKKERTEKGWKIRIPKADIPIEAVSAAVVEPFMQTQTGEEGYYVLPTNMQRKGCFITRFRERENTKCVQSGHAMPIFATKRGEQALLAIVTGMALDYNLVCGVTDGQYFIYPEFDFSDLPAYEDVAIEYILIEGAESDYSGIARTYRKYKLDRGDCIPYAKRAEENPMLKYASECFTIRLRLGWKPRPTPAVHQTRENEPEMRVVMPFSKVERLIEEFHTQGIDKAEFMLVGWNSKGHDGRFPQHFPIEEDLGGEEGFKKVIETGKKYGYLVDSFTNSTCAYRVADCWDEEFVVKNKDGSLFYAEEVATGSGIEYRLCPKRAHDFAEDILSRVAAYGSNGLHYIDVISVVEPFVCHDERHPCNRAQSVAYYKDIMAMSRKYFGGSSSEGGWDYYAADLDYALYIDFDLESEAKRSPLCDMYIPLWQLIYHGIIMSNPNSLTINYPVKERKAMLQCVEYGARPAIYYYGSYCDPCEDEREDNIGNWMGDKDIRCDTEEDLIESVRILKKEYDRYQTLCRLQMLFMDQHTMLTDDVSLVRYSDGTEIICNYGDSVYEYNGNQVNPMDYIMLEPKTAD